MSWPLRSDTNATTSSPWTASGLPTTPTISTAGCKLAFVVVDDPDRGPGNGQADRSLFLASRRVGRHQRGRLGEPVALPDRDRWHAAADLLLDLVRQRRGAAGQVLKRG